ncbi:MAG: RNA polymerase sigma factor [Bacteroidota bacterium]
MVQIDTDEWALIQKSRKGDEAAFRQLVLTYESQVAKTVMRFLGHTPVAEDVGQEVFIQLYRSLDKFKGDAKLGTYITRIAINLSLNELKRQQRRSFIGLWTKQEQGAVPLPISDDSLSEAQRATINLVHQALQMLEPKYRAILVLRMLEGYKTKEVAEMLQLPMGTVLSRLSRGQDKLKDIIKRLETV